MVTIEEWFKTKDYGIGLAILGRNSKNRILLQNLSRKPNPAKLEYELKKIAARKGIILSPEVPGESKPEKSKEKAGSPETPPENVTTEETTGETTPVPSQEQTEPSGGGNASRERDQGKKEESNPDQVNEKKLAELESDAEDIVSDKLSDLEADADDLVTDKVKELEKAADELVSGKTKIIRDGKEISYEELPAEMKARWDQNRDNYKEIRALHEKLKLMEKATPQDRQPLTQRICDLDEQIRKNWEAIDSWQPGSGSGENETASPEIDHKRIQANRKYISTNLKKFSGLTDPVKIAGIVSKLQARYDELIAAGETVAQETTGELTKAGVQC